MRGYEISDPLKKILKKVSNKDKILYESVLKKIEEIIASSDIEHYKNLKYGLKDSKRVHIGHFVLVFRFVGDKVYFDDFDHHDNIY